MAQSFNCPQCGAPVQYTGEEERVTCVFCGSQAPVSAEQVNAIRAKKLGAKAKPWVIVFVLPTCLGLVGTFLGVAAGFLGPLIAIIVSIFGGS
jgi:hypothetical protein